jgi:putative tryptophan/tyrosine transport system substrate-binding protein
MCGIRRREFITLLGGAAAVWPVTARAQTQRTRRIGMLMGYPMGDWEAQADIEAFRAALDRLGWTRRNTLIDIRWGEPDDLESMQQLAKELIELQPDLLVSHTTPTTVALLKQTRVIPIVFTFVSDPVGSGFIRSFLRPGGNITGLDMSEPVQAGKWVGLLKEIAPSLTRVAMLYNPASATYAEFWLNPFRAAAAAFGMQAISAPIRTMPELESVIAAQAREPNSAVIVMPDSYLLTHRVSVTSAVSRYGLPAVYPDSLFTEVGGLLSYGVEQIENFRRAANYVDRILKGTSPSDLPVQSSVNFMLVVNLTTAKKLGLTIPHTLLQRVDMVIR